MNMTGLYHCTDFESLLNILKSQAFWHPLCCDNVKGCKSEIYNNFRTKTIN